MYCKNCDMQNPDGSVVCKYCGVRLQAAKAENVSTGQAEAVSSADTGKNSGGKGLFGLFGKKK